MEEATVPMSGESLHNQSSTLGLCLHLIGAHIKYSMRHFGQMCSGAGERSKLQLQLCNGQQRCWGEFESSSQGQAMKLVHDMFLPALSGVIWTKCSKANGVLPQAKGTKNTSKWLYIVTQTYSEICFPCNTDLADSSSVLVFAPCYK